MLQHPISKGRRLTTIKVGKGAHGTDIADPVLLQTLLVFIFERRQLFVLVLDAQSTGVRGISGKAGE